MWVSTTVPWLVLVLITVVADAGDWKCPELNETSTSCSCDFPHTLRCTVDVATMAIIPEKLKLLPAEDAVSLLDLTIENMTALPDSVLDGVPLHGLVITSGELRTISVNAFRGLPHSVQALGLPNNRLGAVPSEALHHIRDLERLDLSQNLLTRLNSTSFRALNNLTYLDLSENLISNMTEDTFTGLKLLKVLNMRKNGLSVAALPALSRLTSVEKIDLSENALIGPLQSDTLPRLPSVQTLFLAGNQFTSICQDALMGASSLLNLSLNHNHIDVLEDHAFRGLSSLQTLYLAGNRIVAISGSSLAHLSNLTVLDLSHNFLRALTNDIIVPLMSLRVLHLDDNDISIITAEGLTEKMPLQRLTLSDNPLNCDCTLIDFSMWFNNASRLSAEDRNTAVCMTPPHLENALLREIAPSDLICEDTDDPYDNSVSAQVSGAQIVLRAFSFDGSVITLLWSIDSHVESFTCDALFIYEEMSIHESLLNSTPLRCNSTQLADPTSLAVRLPVGEMQAYHRYRYCIVLLEHNKYSDEMQLILGCSEIIPLIASEKSVPQPPPVSNVRILALEANVSFSVLTISVHLWSDHKLTDVKCHVTVTVFMMGTLLTQHSVNCSNPKISIAGLPQGHYHVCATLGTYPTSETRLHCVTVKAEKLRGTSGSLLVVCFVLLTAFALLGLYVLGRKMLKRSRFRSTRYQCFLARNKTEDDDRKQHSRYVKLHTTTVM